GIGFKGMPESIRKLLIGRLVNFDMTPILTRDDVSDMEDSFNAIRGFASVVFKQQIRFIEENIMLFEKYKDNMPQLHRRLGGQFEELIRRWIKKYPVKTISRSM